MVFVDDILVYGETQTEHDTALQQVLAILADKQFRLNVTKCQLQVDEVTFLELRVNQSGVHLNPEKITPIKHGPQLKNLKQIQAFLGAVNYLPEFLPHLDDMVEPLHILTRKGEPFLSLKKHPFKH